MDGERTRTRRHGRQRQLLEFGVMLLVAFALVFGVVRPVIAAPFEIPTESMVPTIKVDDRVLANKFIYDFSEPERGDIVVFVPFQKDAYIKRVVGLPGDRIELQQGKLSVNGEPKDEPYIAAQPCLPWKPNTCSYGPVTVPPGTVFVMGDNRAHSEDSRFIGPVPEESIEGEAFLRFWPPGRIGVP